MVQITENPPMMNIMYMASISDLTVLRSLLVVSVVHLSHLLFYIRRGLHTIREMTKRRRIFIFIRQLMIWVQLSK